MTRDETIALFLECEQKRYEAYAVAIADGIKASEAYDTSYHASSAHWNAWTKRLLNERKCYEATGQWETKREAWQKAAKTDFFGVQFRSQRGAELIKPELRESINSYTTGSYPTKSICVSGISTDFSKFIFPDEALFYQTQFYGHVWFNETQFHGDTCFSESKFYNLINFTEAKFYDNLAFDNVEFHDVVKFDKAQFHNFARFEKSQFYKRASFNNAHFYDIVAFDEAQFHGGALFKGSQFHNKAKFENISFNKAAWFESTRFYDQAQFKNSNFKNDTSFKYSGFQNTADFSIATFHHVANFDNSQFLNEVDFTAVQSRGAFSLANATFFFVPRFIQAHFEEAPRLDHVRINKRMFDFISQSDDMTWNAWFVWQSKRLVTCPIRVYKGVIRRISKADVDAPAHWRSLRRLAIQGHDADREHEYFSWEIRSDRFVNDWPLPFPFWKTKSWTGFFQFWAGLAYQVFSNFGRSILRPLIFWLFAIVIGATFYLCQNEDMARELLAKQTNSIVDTTTISFDVWWKRRLECYAGDKEKPKQLNSTDTYVGSLSPSLAKDTNPAAEAWHLAIRNAFVVLDSSSEAAHRIYGCLYGVEMYGGSSPIAVVPSAVSTASAIQKLFCGIFIFLFGLGLRNMLKMK